ncbi:MAG TPA: type II secretion system secretin GspD [Rhodospirillales bacterium]|nr:type II secretion system secretin GspD [Rhodospirillales bacterium]
MLLLRHRPMLMLAAMLAMLVVVACGTSQPVPPRDTFSRTPAGEPPSRRDVTGSGPVLPDRATEPRKPPSLYPGSNVVTRRLGERDGVSRATPEGEITLNFVNADLQEVIKAVLGDTLGLNYVIDPRVQGAVTLQTGQPVPAAALLSTLQTILELNGAALVEAEGLYRIVPGDEAVRGGARLRGSLEAVERRPGTSVMVVPLRFIGAAEMQKLLEPLSPQGAVLRADTSRNILILGGSQNDLINMVDMINTFDVDWLAGKSFGIFPLQSSQPEAVVGELEAIFSSKEEGALAGVVRFVPIERMNAVLVIANQSAYLDRARAWIERLDVGDEAVPRLYVYYVENSRAEDLSLVLSDIFTPGAVAGRPDLAPGLTPSSLRGDQLGFDGTTGSRLGFGGGLGGGLGAGGLGTGGLSQRGAASGLGAAAGLGRSGGASRQLGAPSRNRQQTLAARARATASRLRQPATGEEELPTKDPVRIIADPVKNALVIYATPSDYREVGAVLKRLDTIPLQVLIEATILEVSLDDELRYGVEWFFNSGDNSFSLSSLATGAVGSIFPGFSYALRTGDVRFIVNALETVTNVRVVSSPLLLVLDNQTAALQVGNEVPISTQSSVSTVTADAPVINSIEYRNTGVILDVTPRVNTGGLVTLELGQEVSDAVRTTSSDLNSPTFEQRRVESTIAVQDGEAIAIGGLIRDRDERTDSGVPLLKDIPLLGFLFGTTANQNTRTELLILLTPRVVGSQEEAQRLTNEIRRRLHGVTELEERVR